MRLGLLALALSLTALPLGFQADDHVYRLAVARDIASWRIFTLSAADMAAQRFEGFWPWWTSPRVLVDFLRPLTYVVHWLEHTLFWNVPAAMYLINGLVYAACVALATKLYARLLPSSRTAALAGLMYTVDEAHSHSVGWISGRNTLLAATFSLAALLCHLEARATRARKWQLLGAAFVSLALLSGEAGVWSVGLVVAYALAGEDAPLRQRLLSLAPTLLVAAVWAAYYAASGPHGAPGSEFYRELSKPFTVIASGVLDLPIWTASLLWSSVATTLLLVPLWLGRMVGLALALPPLAWLASVLPDKRARFFALAALLCVLPVLLTVPQDRTAIGATFGAFGWIACFVERAATAGRLMRIGRWLLLAVHVPIALLAFPIGIRSVSPVEKATQRLVAQVEPGKRVMLLTAPTEIAANYGMNILSLPENRSRRPAAIHTLYAGSSDLTVRRIDPRTLEIEVPRGWGYVPFERPFCADDEFPRVGEERRVHGMSVTVLTTTKDGRPSKVRFELSDPLESENIQWLHWTREGPTHWTPPPLGHTTHVTNINALEALPF